MRRKEWFARGATAVLVLAAAAVVGHVGVAPAAGPAHDGPDAVHGALTVRHDVAVDLATAGTARPDPGAARPDRTTPTVLPAAALAGVLLALGACVASTRRRVTRAPHVGLPGRRAPPLLAA